MTNMIEELDKIALIINNMKNKLQDLSINERKMIYNMCIALNREIDTLAITAGQMAQKPPANSPRIASLEIIHK